MSRYYRTLARKFNRTLLENLVAYYPMNGNSNDLVNGYNGIDNSISYVSGKNNLCADFTVNTSTGSIILVNDQTDFSFTNGTNDLPFSVSFWLKLDTLQTSSFVFFISKRLEASINAEWQIIKSKDSNKIRFTKFSNGYTGSYIDFNSDYILSSLDIDNWINIVITSDGVGVKIYVNGLNTAVTSSTVGTYEKMANTTSKLAIGKSEFNTSSVYSVDGKLDEIAIWKNRELTATEVVDLYNSGVGKFYPFN